MICSIEISKNIVPTTKELEHILKCYMQELKPYHDQLVKLNKYCLNVRYLLNDEGLKRIETKEEAKVRIEIQKIKNQYLKKYAPYFV